MPGRGWEELVRRVQEETARRYRENLLRPRPFHSVWAPLTVSAYEEAHQLKNTLLQECAGRSLLDFYSGEVHTTEYGPVLSLWETPPIKPFIPEREVGEAWIMQTLRLLHGIGKATEARLKLSGYVTLRDLLFHPRWAWQVERILEAVERRDLHTLNHLVARWFPVSHPIALALLGFVKPEEIVFLDIETLGLYTEAVILIGLAYPQNGVLLVKHLVVREIAEELPVLVALLKELQRAKALVTYNGRAFDVNFIQARLRYYDLPHKIDLPNFDLLPFTRRCFRESLPNCRLETVEKAISVERTINIPSALVPEFYMEYLREKNVGPLVAIIEHNRQDLLSLVLILRKLWEELVMRGL
ncbi:MAG: ribonuclease H-like domain-containing protein [Candidatus Bipolaricaulota bacterium]|nr:ribonuclease H-like domain-containing protein [Candidatus Bipolaricaulota bacterium]MDW8126170.1 ribonuclease H-like domain-containing protein [Candidatus Bipolaricaulota bacterium]